MSDVRKVCQDELERRIKRAEMLIESAKSCLSEREYLQCAVRLQEMEQCGQFTETEMNIFDALYSERTEASE